jgi:hypothetical protein
MRVGARRAARVLLAAAALAVSLCTSPVAALTGNARPELPANLPTKVAIVAQGAPVGAEVAVLVVNRTDRSVRDVRLTGTATSADGTARRRARSAVVVPAAIAPGELAVARVGFGKAPLAAGDHVEVAVRSSRPSASPSTPFSVRDAVLSRPLSGPVAQQLAVTLANGSTRAVRASGTLGVMCFGEAQNPVLTVTTRVPRTKVAAGATTTATVDLPELCPSYLVGFSPTA